MKKRILALLLCLGMLMPILSLFASSANAEETAATPYDYNIGKKATFNPTYIEWGSFPISNNPAEEDWATATQLKKPDVTESLVVVIAGVYVDEAKDVYWYKVTAAEGHTLPALLETESWVYQNSIAYDSPESCSLLIIEEPPVETDPTETNPTETNPTETDPTETDPTETDPTETDPTEADPTETDPTETHPTETDPTETDPTETDPTETDPTETDPTETDPTETDPTETDPTETDPTEDDPAEEEPEEPELPDDGWMAYSQYVAAQVSKILADPTYYVGFQATFDATNQSEIQYASNPGEALPEEETWIDLDNLKDENGNPIQIVITEAVTDEQGRIWYKIEAAEGESLPQALVENPYILNLENENDTPALVILPLQGMFVGETVIVQRQNVMASAYVELNTADLPEVFDVTPVGGGWYDIGDVSRWVEGMEDSTFRYVSEAYVQLVPPELTVAKAELKNLQKVDSFAECVEHWLELPQCVRDVLDQQYATQLEELMNALQSVKHETTVDFNGTPLRVDVQGPIPKTGVALNVQVVDSATILSQGFDIKSASEIIAALDIKLLKPDGTEWQPEHGEQIAVSIGMAELGYTDGSIVRMHHKHGETIDAFDMFIVMGGKVTISTSGFSIYVVSAPKNETRGEAIAPNTRENPIVLSVGDNKVYYFWRQNNRPNIGTWSVKDTSGAIHYVVYSNSTLGHDGMYCPWIEIDALKETTSDAIIELTFTHNGNNSPEKYYIKIETPKAAAGQKKLYIKDMVNTTGSIIATVVDDKGAEVSLEGAAFNWSRYDEVNGNMFIVPHAYEQNYRAVNIARDHGGLVEARKTNNAYVPTVYSLEVILADGTELDASYTVYYQSEIINAGFEFPNATNSNFTMFPNGWPELYWQTTAPGSGGKLTQDIEYGDVTNGTANANNNGTDFGVTRAADHAQNGVQFAELNAEAFGALYQDIISVPHESIEWDFSHAPRRKQSWNNGDTANKMFVVIGPTEEAQKLTSQEQLLSLGTAAKTAAQAKGNEFNTQFLSGKVAVTVTFNDVQYSVVYHDAGAPGQNNTSEYTAEKNYGWTKLEGSYEVPDGQYRTRLFFVTDPPRNNQGNIIESTQNFGNLIDAARAGQYKTYLIEYYEQTYVDGVLKTERINSKEESGEALVFSSAELKNYDYFISTEHDYLYKIMINGNNYPYDIRYSGKASLYIEHYDGTAEDPLGGNRDYSKYDIVMQVYLRDTVIAVEKELQFPALLTEEQKLKIMTDLGQTGGYKATFALTSNNPDYPIQNSTAVVTNRDPMGKYKGYVALGENPVLGYAYSVEETNTSQITGLELSKVKIGVTRYRLGQKYDEMEEVSYTEINIDGNEKLISNPFTLEEQIKIADVSITNIYEEKETIIEYKAVGKGKVVWLGEGEQQYQDAPTETLAFYSGKAVGAKPQAGDGATFVGWYLDEACTKPVQNKDGVYYEDTDKSFKPNANIIDKEKVTFYAKFVTNSITIERTNAEPGQVFVYHVTNKAGTDTPALDTYVTVVCGDNSSGKTVIEEVAAGTYTVTEVYDWSWRFQSTAPKAEEQEVTVEMSAVASERNATVSFSGARTSDYWLSGISNVIKNVFQNVEEVPKS